MKNYIFIILSLIFFGGCAIITVSDAGGMAGTGPIIAGHANVDYWNEIVLNIRSNNGNVDVNFTHGEPSVNYTIEENLAEFVVIEQVGQRLYIGASQTLRNANFIVNLSSPSLTHISFDGVMHFNGEIDEENLNINIQGVNVIELTGYVNYLNLQVTGVNTLMFRNLRANIANVDISGVNTVQINASEELNGRISGISNLTYFGNPEMGMIQDGVANIIRGE